MGDKNKFKRGAQGDKGRYNPVNSRTPEEYICVIGSASNTFNGYMYVDPRTNDWVACKEPEKLADVPAYIKGPPGHTAVTHDLYWANFLDPALKLYVNKMVRPKAGDILTFLVFMAGYIKRQQVDWDASPYNARHQYSPWVRGNPEYDALARESGSTTPPPQSSSGKKEPPPPAADYDPEHVINHDILMRTTSANKDGIIKRPYDEQNFIQYIHNMPRKVVYGKSLAGDAVMPDVLVKLLLFNQVSDLAAYLKTGAFPGAKYWKHILNTVDERDMGSMIQVTDVGRYFDAVLDFSGRPWAARWKRLLKQGAKPPEVNRAKIKIKRFDYIGHSDGESFYLNYGWGNKKGELPNKEVTAMFTDEVIDALPMSAVTGDAFAYLWGCNLGEQMGPGLTVRFKEVVACETDTYFDHILDSDASMPVPGPGHRWKTFKRK